METETDFSWLQKRHWKVVGSFSFYEEVNKGREMGATAYKYTYPLGTLRLAR
jgi:hypothetical protein